jgi:hypothetical protein
MRKYKLFLAVALVTALNLGVGFILPVHVSPDTVAAEKDPSPPNPDRPYYDGFGNQFKFDGTLMHATCPNVPDSVTGQNNPECVCPADTSAGAYFIRGNDKNTNAVTCGFTYFNACPYAEGYAATDPMCEKFAAQQPITATPSKPNQCGGK